MGISIRVEFHIYVNRKSGEKANSKPECKSKSWFLKSAAEEIERLRTVLSLSTIENYKTAVKAIGRYLKKDVDISAVDQKLIKGFERWLREQNICLNTISCYMRSLRSLVNRLITDGSTNAFKDVYTGRAKTEKRAIAEADIVKIRQATLRSGSFLSLTRDVFLFSYYALGMPFVDIAFLRRSQIAGNVLTFYRHKTGQRVIVPLEPCALEILSRYQDRGEYVFPILKSLEPQKAYKEYLQALNRYNRSLKSLACKSELNVRLTSYTARHTWASVANDTNVDLPVISKALGHTNTKTTQTYIREINDNRLAEANRKLVSRILYSQ